MHTAFVRQALSRRTFFGAALLLAIGWSLSGCDTYVRYGDARLVQTHPILMMGDLYTEFPKVPIGALGTVSYRVPGHLDFTGLRVEVPEAEADPANHNQPWRSTILRVKVIEGNGRVIDERRIDLARDWKGGFDTGEHGKNRALILSFPAHPSPAAASYPNAPCQIEVEVIRPSRRKTDYVRIVTNR